MLPPWRPACFVRSVLACLCMAGSLLATPASAQGGLPHLGDGAELSLSQERALGDSIITSLYRDPDYLDDAPLHAYVMQIWQPLVQAALQRGDLSEELYQRFAWQVLLGRDRSINAFALPGGYLGVHTGLIGAVAHRDELATVLAHELSHVTQRHIARMFAEEKKNIPLLIGGLVLGALAASSSPDAAQALIIGGQAAAVQNQLSFSRDMEREADRVGFNLLSPAGFNPQGAASMFDKLQQASRLNDNGSWPYLRSHPLTSERIADMQARVPHGRGTPLQTQWEDAMMAARARVLSQPGVDRLRQWVAQPGQSDFAQQPAAQRAAILYAAALASQQLRDTAGAHACWRQLDALVPASDAAARRQSAWPWPQGSRSRRWTWWSATPHPSCAPPCSCTPRPSWPCSAQRWPASACKPGSPPTRRMRRPGNGWRKPGRHKISPCGPCGHRPRRRWPFATSAPRKTA